MLISRGLTLYFPIFFAYSMLILSNSNLSNILRDIILYVLLLVINNVGILICRNLTRASCCNAKNCYNLKKQQIQSKWNSHGKCGEATLRHSPLTYSHLRRTPLWCTSIVMIWVAPSMTEARSPSSLEMGLIRTTFRQQTWSAGCLHKIPWCRATRVDTMMKPRNFLAIVKLALVPWLLQRKR